MSSPEQLRDEGMARALAAQTAAWRDAVRAEIERRAALGVPFTSDDVSAVTGDSPTGSRGAMGAAFRSASQRGVIRSVGMVKSRRRTVHAKRVEQWCGTAAEAA